MIRAGAWCVALAVLGGPAAAIAQERDSVAAAGWGVYLPPEPPPDTAAPEAAAADTADTAETEEPVETAETADTVVVDTSLTARMDVRRGGGLRRSEFPDLRRSAEMGGRYTVCLELADRSELGDRLTGDGLVTALAPTDSAFARLPARDLARLRGDPALREAWLGTVLLDGSWGVRELLGEGEARSVGGEVISFSRGRDGWIHAGPGRLVHVDMLARNGTLHGVDRVTLPDTTSASP